MTQLSSRARALVVSLILLAFVAGASAGIAGDRLVGSKTIRIRASVGDMSAVFDRLELTPEQRRQADAIVERSAPRSHAIMLEVAERLGVVADSVDAELRSILTAEQRARLDAMKRDSRLMLKRKVVTPGGTTVDTFLRR